MGIHDGHRRRTVERFLDNGLDSFDDHSALELLLFYALPRGDTNPLAHILCDQFGSLAGVFDAPAAELMKISGIGENAAGLIKLIPELSRRYAMACNDLGSVIDSSEKAGRFLVPYYIGERSEAVYLLCLDGKGKLLKCRFMGRGSVNSANISIRKLVETALLHNAVSVILSHNHTSGIALPSPEDIETTRKVRKSFDAVGINLADHIIVGGSDFVSLADSGVI